MSAIRPLATIAILAALGVFLAWKIQEDPLAPTAQRGGEWGDASAYGDAGGDAPSFGGPSMGDAPGFGDPPAFPSPTLQPPGSTPSMPAMPAMPTMPGPSGSAASQPTAVDPSQLDLPDLPLPANIPQANYGGSASNGVSANAGATGLAPTYKAGISGRVPSLGTATPDVEALASRPTMPTMPPATPAPSAATPALDNSLTTPPAASAYGMTPTPPPAPAAPTSPAPSNPAPSSPYAPPQSAMASSMTPPPTPPTPPMPPEPPTSGYATARPAIQAALDRDELSRAHLLLSQWYGDPSLSSEERREVDRLLSQLAGSVIYSGEHRLEPPHQVQPGETLESIAKKYDTPWQLLAKINGVPRADAVQPGQILKVVRGPFKAVVDLSESELYLTVDGRYAGRFPVGVDGIDGEKSLAVSKLVRYEPTSPLADEAGYVKYLSFTQATGQDVLVSATGIPGPLQPQISVAANDLGDLYDILSEGSEVTIRK